jgi:hypothetical protein
MSGTNDNAIGFNVNPTGANQTAGTQGSARTGVVVGGAALNFPITNRPSPGPAFFEKAKGARSDPSYLQNPR